MCQPIGGSASAAASSHSPLAVAAKPLAHSIADSFAVKPFWASRAASSPFSHAFPAWNDLDIVPTMQPSPAAWVAANASAVAVRSASSDSSREQAAAAPTVPIVPVW